MVVVGVIHMINILYRLLMFPFISPLRSSTTNHVVFRRSDVTIKWLLSGYRHFGSVDHIVGHILIQDIQHFNHGHGEGIRFLFAAEVESIDLSVVSPLMECRSGLIVFQTFENSAVDHHLMMDKSVEIQDLITIHILHGPEVCDQLLGMCCSVCADKYGLLTVRSMTHLAAIS